MTSADANSDQTQFRIVVHLPNGLQCTLQLFGSQTFAELRDQCWAKKQQAFNCQKAEARFRLFTTPYYFSNESTITNLVHIYPSFEQLGQLDRYSIKLETPADIGDQEIRRNMRADSKRPFFWQGYLIKCSKQTGKGFWQKRYFVFQNQTLFWYSNQDSFLKGNKAQKVIPMGGICPTMEHASAKNANKKFPFVVEIPPHVRSKHLQAIYVLAGSTNAIRRSFCDCLQAAHYYCQCAMVLNILPYLYPFCKTEGIFRLAGNSTKIKLTQEAIDSGHIPHFEQNQGEITAENLHIYTGLLKRQLRFMRTPLIPGTHFRAVIEIGNHTDLDTKIDQLAFACKSLPSTAVLILSELFSFLHYACQFSETSKMGATNFAIVIGPNLLRSAEEYTNPMQAMEDNKLMQSVVSTFIEHHNKILPNKRALYDYDRRTNAKFGYGVVQQQQHAHGSMNNNNNSGGPPPMAFALPGMAHGQSAPPTQEHQRQSGAAGSGGLASLSNKMAGIQILDVQHSHMMSKLQASAPNLQHVASLSSVHTHNAMGAAGALGAAAAAAAVERHRSTSIDAVASSSKKRKPPPPHLQFNLSSVEKQQQHQHPPPAHPQERPQSAQHARYNSNRPMIGHGQLHSVQLKKTSFSPTHSNSSTGHSNRVDFRANLRKINKPYEPASSSSSGSSSSRARPPPPLGMNASVNSGAFDFRSNLKPRNSGKKGGGAAGAGADAAGAAGVSNISVNADAKRPSIPPPFDPTLLSNYSSSSQQNNPRDSGGGGGGGSNNLQLRGLPVYNPETPVVARDDPAMDLSFAGSPKQPPPNPMEEINDKELQTQKLNDKILLEFQSFEDKMAQFDEDIEFKQSFAETLASQVMELAEKGQITNAAKHLKTVHSRCKSVLEAAQRHAQSLQKFNHSMQTLYSQLLDAIEEPDENMNGNNAAGSAQPSGKYVTPGGPADDGKEQGGGGGGLPKYNAQESVFEDDANVQLQTSEKTELPQPPPPNKHGRQSSTSGNKKVAKALYDYPGGYRKNELTFHRGTSLIINKEKEGWVYGYYELEPKMHGWFPKSYVKILTE